MYYEIDFMLIEIDFTRNFIDNLTIFDAGKPMSIHKLKEIYEKSHITN